MVALFFFFLMGHHKQQRECIWRFTQPPLTYRYHNAKHFLPIFFSGCVYWVVVSVLQTRCIWRFHRPQVSPPWFFFFFVIKKKNACCNCALQSILHTTAFVDIMSDRPLKSKRSLDWYSLQTGEPPFHCLPLQTTFSAVLPCSKILYFIDILGLFMSLSFFKRVKYPAPELD